MCVFSCVYTSCFVVAMMMITLAKCFSEIQLKRTNLNCCHFRLLDIPNQPAYFPPPRTISFQPRRYSNGNFEQSVVCPECRRFFRNIQFSQSICCVCVCVRTVRKMLQREKQTEKNRTEKKTLINEHYFYYYIIRKRKAKNKLMHLEE